MHFNWLHLTDFHQGMRDQDWLWPNMQEEFFRDLERLHAKTGPWDLILFTGDLSDRGNPQEYVRFEQEMGKLRRRLNEIAPGTRPLFLAVPGNHDLIRPAAKDPLVKLLNRWGEDPDVAQEFWTDGTCGYRQVIDTAFAGYTGWWEAQAAHLPGYRRGLLPGDFSATIEKEGARLGILGLNTAFLQLGDGDYQGRLALHARQFHGACGGSGPEWARGHHVCLLLTHHSPAWLDQDSRGQLDGQIASYGRFALHLFGHAHETALRQLSEGGTETRRQFQGRSLFGLEHYQEIRNGKVEPKVDRSHGYAAGQLRIESQDTGNLVLWPRRAWPQGGQLALVAEPDIKLPTDEHTRPLPFDLLQPYRRPGGGPGGGPGGPGTGPTAIAITLDIGLDELSSPLLRRMIDAIQQIGGSVQLRLIQPGSVRLLLVGDAADIRRIEDAYRAGQLATLAGTRVRDIQGVAALPPEAAARLPLDLLLSQAQTRYRAGTQAPAAQPAAARPWDLQRLRRDGILDELAQVFDQQSAAHALLEHAGFPRRHLAPFGTGTPAQFWESVCREVMNGRMDGGMDALLAEAADEYPGNGVFRPWRREQSAPENREYAPTAAAPTQDQGADRGPSEGQGNGRGEDWEFLVLGCDEVHLVIDEARAALAALAVGGATVGLNYGVPGLIGLQVAGLDAGQAADLRQALEVALPAGTQVQLASPGFRDYLYSRLWMTGPDQARFELSNVPASTRVADLAKAGITQYDDAMWPRDKNGLQRPAVVDHDRADGTTQRLDPDQTLHESGVADGDTLHVAPEASAGSVNPILREQGLVRARLQIKEFADSHPGFEVRANAVQTPTEYLFLFSVPGFAPPPTAGAAPLPADDHKVLLRLPEDFPMKAPVAYWRTPVFHPNVARENGLVCLGVLADGYRPGMHFGDLCQMLLDMAAYRNYEVREFYDEAARDWALSDEGQAAIERRGGRSLLRWVAGVLDQQGAGLSRPLRIKRSD